jgi:hypothetical protein
MVQICQKNKGYRETKEVNKCFSDNGWNPEETAVSKKQKSVIGDYINQKGQTKNNYYVKEFSQIGKTISENDNKWYKI